MERDCRGAGGVEFPVFEDSLVGVWLDGLEVRVSRVGETW